MQLQNYNESLKARRRKMSWYNYNKQHVPDKHSPTNRLFRNLETKINIEDNSTTLDK